MAVTAEIFILLLPIARDASSPLYLNKGFGTNVTHSESTNIVQEKQKANVT